jgi:hypothetical protein
MDTEIHKLRLVSLKQSGLEALELNRTINRFRAWVSESVTEETDDQTIFAQGTTSIGNQGDCKGYM